MYIVMTYGNIHEGVCVGLVSCSVDDKAEEVTRWFEKKMAFPDRSIVGRIVEETIYRPEQPKSNELGG